MLEQINLLSEVNPYLPYVIKLFLLLVGVLIVFIPLSLVSFGYVYFFSKQILKVFSFLDALSLTFEKYSKKIIQKSNLLKKKYLLKVTPSSQVSAHVIETVGSKEFKALSNNIYEQISLLPKNEQSTSKEIDNKEVQNIILEMKNMEQNFVKLENIKNDFEKDDFAIPQAKIKEEDYLIKREGYANLIFVPLLIAVMVLNTYLLNLFFREMVAENNNIFGYSFPIKLSHLISFLFTMVEAGIGIHFARFESFKARENTINKVVNTFAWSVLGLLIFIEFFIYLQLCIENYAGVPVPEFFDENPSFIEIIYNSWLSAFGPAIVFGLFIFGHQSTMAYFKIMKSNDLHSLNRELDRADARVVQISEVITKINDDLIVTKDKIREMSGIKINNEKVEQKKNSKLENDLSEIKGKLISFLEKLEKEIKNIPEKNNPVNQTKEQLQITEQKSLYSLDVAKGFGLIILTITMILGLNSLASEPSSVITLKPIEIISYGLALSISLSISGYLFYQSNNLIIDGEVFSLRSTSLDYFKKIITVIYFITVIIIFGLIINYYPEKQNYAITCIAISFALFLIGFQMKIALFGIGSFIYYSSIKIISYLLNILNIFTYILKNLLIFIDGILTALSRPWVRLFSI